jgi:hypothetical protein
MSARWSIRRTAIVALSSSICASQGAFVTPFGISATISEAQWRRAGPRRQHSVRSSSQGRAHEWLLRLAPDGCCVVWTTDAGGRCSYGGDGSVAARLRIVVDGRREGMEMDFRHPGPGGPGPSHLVPGSPASVAGRHAEAAQLLQGAREGSDPVADASLRAHLAEVLALKRAGTAPRSPLPCRRVTCSAAGGRALVDA